MIDVESAANEIADAVLFHDDDDHDTCDSQYCMTCGIYCLIHTTRADADHDFVSKPCSCGVIEKTRIIADTLRRHFTAA